MKLEIEDDWVSKRRKTLDKQVYNIARAREANGSTHLVNTINSHVKRTKTGTSFHFQSLLLSVSLTKFQNVKNFEDFKISVGVIDSEIPIHIRKRYYELCCAQKMFLHDHLIEGLSSKFLGSMISETVNIFDALMQSNINTSHDQFKCWDKTLSCFEGLGMSVGFLRTGLNNLMKLYSEIKAAIESGRHNDNSFSNIQESSQPSVSLTKFKNVMNFEDFKIRVGVIIIDSEIPIDIRKKYYELCCSQKMFLHDHLIESLSCKFLGSVISETVNIVDAIGQSKINTPRHQFKLWSKTLSCFEGLGMSVGFLHTWLNKLMKLNSEMKATIESGSHNDNSFSNIQESSDQLSVSLTKFKNVKNFEDFKSSAGVIIIDSKIPIDIRKKYYKLCCGRKMFLHDHLIKGLSRKFLGSIISETVNIVDAIRQSNINTSGDQFKCWDKTLSCFEGLGMSVGFLRTWLNKLMKVNSEMKATLESFREKRVRLDEEMKSLNKSEELMSSLRAELLYLEVKKEKLGVEFMKLAFATKL